MALPPQIVERLVRLKVRSADVKEQFIRGTGPGGQKINKTSSTVALRHLPSGTEVRCQTERSQAANRRIAWEELCNKLERRERDELIAVRHEREAERRRTRPKSLGQKLRMLETKKIRAAHKARRRKISRED